MSAQTPGTSDATSGALDRSYEWLYAAALIVAVFLAYQPVWNGGFLWDDHAHVPTPAMQSWHGLYRIWFDVLSTQQYYPLLDSTFWLEHKLWGNAASGYHLVNILMHTVAAVLLAAVLRRLEVPGAYLAAAIFALHPTHVDSVAWITEQKNTQSAALYFAAMLAYLHFDQSGRLGTGPFFGGRRSLADQRPAENMDLSPSAPRKARFYVTALVLFVLSMWCKTVTATLPAALLVIFWWRRGKLSWRRDVLPTVPLFLVSLACSAFTVWRERLLLESNETLFTLTLGERVLLAGRAIWFYLGKLFWPAHLAMIYPRWHLDPTVWRQYLFPIAALLLLAALWALRRRWRGPLAAMLLFVGTLAPAIGLSSLFWFTYSYVAGHLQYLADPAIIALAAASIALALQRWRLWNRPAGYALCLALLATLATLTWQHTRIYANVETLYPAMIAANPDCWMAHDNMAGLRMREGRLKEALAVCQRVLDIRPNYARGHYNLALVLDRLGQSEASSAEYLKALEIKPDYADAHYNLANALARQERLTEAIAHYRKVLKLQPKRAAAYNNLGKVLLDLGQFDNAIVQCQEALKINPQFAPARVNLDDARARRTALRNELDRLRTALGAEPNNVVLLNDAAWILATNPNAPVRNGPKAVELAQKAAALTGGQEPAILGTLAAAYAEAGRFAEAIETAQKALNLATQQDKQDITESIKAKLQLYQAGVPFRDRPLSAPDVRPR